MVFQIPVRHLPSPGPVHYAIPQISILGGIPAPVEPPAEALGPICTSLFLDESKFSDMYATLIAGNYNLSNTIETLNYMQFGGFC